MQEEIQEQLLFFAAAILGFLIMNIGPAVIGTFLPTDTGAGAVLVSLFTYVGAALFLFFTYLVVREALDRVQLLTREPVERR